MGTQCLEGFKENDFVGISEKHKNKMLKLISQVSETAYRRGVQQGSTLYERGIIRDSGKMVFWRYSIPIKYKARICPKYFYTYGWEKNEEGACCGYFFNFSAIKTKGYQRKEEVFKCGRKAIVEAYRASLL